MSSRDVADEKLIHCVRSFPVIYDLGKKTYKDRIAKHNAWKSIAASLCRTPEDCKARWRTIRDSYKKINKKKKTGSAAASGKSKYNSDNLRFLDTSLQEKRSRCSVQEDETPQCNDNNGGPSSAHGEEQWNDNDEDDEDVGDDFVTGRECTDTGSFNRQNQRSGCEEPDKKKRRTVSGGDQISSEISTKGRDERMHDKKHPDEDNPIFTFFKSMAQSVVQLPPNIIAETKIKICQIVSEMEMKALNEKIAHDTGPPLHFPEPYYSRASQEYRHTSSPGATEYSYVALSQSANPTPTPTPVQNIKHERYTSVDTAGIAEFPNIMNNLKE